MTNIQSAGTGNWKTGGTWAGGNEPAAGDTVEILNGHTITLNGEINAIGATTIRSGGQLTVSYQMVTSAFANITVDSGGKIYASRSFSSLLRVNGKIASNSSYGIDYGKSDDQISNAAVAAYIEIVTASDVESYNTKGIVGGANNFLTMYGAALTASSTLAGSEGTSPENNALVLTDDMALRPSATLADVTNGLADMIILGQNPILGVGAGAQGLQIDAYLVAGYNTSTKTVTLGDAGAGQSYWPRGGTSGNGYDDVDTTRAANTPVYRISSNVGVRGTAYNLRPARLIQGVSYAATFTNCSIWWGYYGINAGNFTYEGVVTVIGCNYGIVSATAGTISGTVICAGCNCAIYAITATITGTLKIFSSTYGVNSGILTSTGTISIYACTYGCYYVATTISGTLNLVGNSKGIYNGRIICYATATLYGNNVGIDQGQHVFCGITTISNSTYGVSIATCILKGQNTFENNTKDIVDPINCACYNVTFGSVDIDYTLANLQQYSYTKSVDHDGVAGAFKAVTKGGKVESTTATKPTGKNWSLKLQPVSTVDPVFVEKQLTLAPGEALTLNIWIQKDAAMAYLPWVAIIDPQNDTLYNPDAAELDVYTMADNTDWQTDTLTYTNNTSYDKEIILRAVAKNGSGNVYFYWERAISSGGSGGASVVGSSIVKAVVN
ncbi:MAG TPA: hypothetical protein PKL29_00070 [Methanothrix sp.]|nr:hypothetical protein [Methanothrix sp.]HPT36689.1 hypothetical protein [Methanothrix sp.]